MFKRSPIVADTRQALGIAESERILAWGIGDSSEPESSFVVATSAALYDQRSHARYPWVDIIKGTWEQPDFHLTVARGTGSQRILLRVDQPNDLPAAVRDRVTDTVVVSEHLDFGEGAGAQFVARREPGGGVEDIRWSVVFDSGLDPGDPALRAAADGALRELRSSLGI